MAAEWALRVPLPPSSMLEIFHAEQTVLIGFQSTHGLPYAGVSTWHLAVCRLRRLCHSCGTKSEALSRLEKGLPPRLHVRWPCPEAVVLTR